MARGPTAAPTRPRTGAGLAPGRRANRRDRGRGGRPGRRHDLGAIPATPELLAKIDALPPATDVPDIPDSLSHAADPQFGLASLLRPVRRVMLIGFALVGLDTVLQLLAPALVRTGIDQGVTGHDSRILFGRLGRRARR